jgi:hypothetical protein
MNTAHIERVKFLVRVVLKEIQHLSYSSKQLFSEPFTIEKAQSLALDEALAQQVEAFSSRFCRLQDTVGDKLIPAWLTLLSEPLGAAIDNLDRAEKLGVLLSVDAWLETRQLRNQMVHEYIESLEILTSALNQAYHDQFGIIACANAIIADCKERKLIELLDDNSIALKTGLSAAQAAALS